MAQTDRHTDTQTDGHGDSMTNSAQRGRVGENPVLKILFLNFMPQICSQKKAEAVMVIEIVMVMVMLKKANIM